MNSVKEIKKGLVVLKIILGMTTLFFIVLLYWYVSGKWGINALVVMSVMGILIIILCLRIRNLKKQIITGVYTEFAPKALKQKLLLIDVLLVVSIIVFLVSVYYFVSSLPKALTFKDLFSIIGPLCIVVQTTLAKSQLTKKTRRNS